MKRAAYYLLCMAGVPALMRRIRGRSLTILLYHGVAPQESRGDIYNYRKKFVTPEQLDQQLRYCAKRYRILPLDEAVQRLKDGTLPKKALAVTFDDGYRNWFEFAYPILKKHRVPATFFVATDFVFTQQPLWVDRLEYAIGRLPQSKQEREAKDRAMRQELKRAGSAERNRELARIEGEAGAALKSFDGESAVYAPLTLPMMRRMQEDGSLFGAHTKSHPVLATLGRHEQDQEIGGSKTLIQEALGTCSSVFAYPNGQPGDWNNSTEDSIIALGFTAAVTTEEAVNTRRTHPMRLGRITIDAGMNRYAFAAAVSGTRAALRTLL